MNTTTAPGAGSGWTSIIMLVALFAIMYFIIIRPQQKKDKQLKAMRDSIKVGDDIVTIGGICGKVLKVSDEKVVIATGAVQTKLEVTKWAVSTVLGQESAPRKKGKDEAEEKKSGRKPIKRLGETAGEAEAAAGEISETEKAAENAIQQ